VDGKELSQGVRVEVDPLASATLITEEEDDEEARERQAASPAIDRRR
jgi:hypothetical protein